MDYPRLTFDLMTFNQYNNLLFEQELKDEIDAVLSDIAKSRYDNISHQWTNTTTHSSSMIDNERMAHQLGAPNDIHRVA